MPSAFKDVSKVYSNLEKKTSNVPVVPDMFRFASSGTQAIGDLLSGNFGRAYMGGQRAIREGGDTLAKMEMMKANPKPYAQQTLDAVFA
jgi:hypothetical protein